jgi:hypothetical protein
LGGLADELGTPTGREHFLTFVKDSAIAAVLIEGVIKSAPFAALLAMGGSAWRLVAWLDLVSAPSLTILARRLAAAAGMLSTGYLVMDLN